MGPLDYITFLLGCETKNSLTRLLKSENLAVELSASEDTYFNALSEVCVSIKLTKKGLAEYERVIGFVM